MDNALIFGAVGIILIYLIYSYDKQQRKRLKKVLKQSSHVEPLLMKQSAVQKLSALQTELAKHAVEVTDPTNLYGKVNSKLVETMNAYNAGNMPLHEYSRMLERLLDAVKKHQASALTAI